jgi:hypothetical protein
VPLLVQYAQGIVNLSRYRWQVDSMNYRQVLDECATGEGRPVEGMGMDEIELSVTLPQLEKEVEEEIGLSEEASIGWTFLSRIRETSWPHLLWYRYLLNMHAGYVRAFPSEHSHAMITAQQPLCKVGQQSLSATYIGLRNGCDKRRDESDSHAPPR